MNRFTLFLFFIATSLISHAQLTNIEIKANQFSSFLIEGQVDSAYAMFSKEVTAQMNKGQLRDLMPTIEGQVGKLDHLDKVIQTEEGEYLVTYQPYHFKETLLDLKLVFNEEELISGMFFVPHKEFKIDLANTDDFYETEIEVVTDKTYRLQGIITLPKQSEKCPAVALVHGSGPNDMDETLGPNKLFKDLAHELAKNGIAVIRYEKRTRAYAGRPELDVASLTLDEETIDDALSAVDMIRKDKRIDKNKVYVLGHSLGGMAAPRIANRSKWVNGIIIMAGNARPFETLIKEQISYIFNQDSTINAHEQAILDQMEEQFTSLSELQANGKTEGQLPFGLSTAYWTYLNEYQQTQVAADLNKPILVLQGKRDYQVTVEDYKKWKSALNKHPESTFHLYEKLNHMMLEGEGLCYPAEYEIKAPLPTYVVNDIVNWIKSQN